MWVCTRMCEVDTHFSEYRLRPQVEVRLGYWTQALMLWQQALYLLSHLHRASPPSQFYSLLTYDVQSSSPALFVTNTSRWEASHFKVCDPFLSWILSFFLVELEESFVVIPTGQNPGSYPLLGLTIFFLKPMESRDAISCDKHPCLFFPLTKPPCPETLWTQKAVGSTGWCLVALWHWTRHLTSLKL